MEYAVIALSEMLIFYAIYFGKMLLQRRRGIETRQLGKNKNVHLRRVEINVSAATLLIVPVELISIIFGLSNSPVWAMIAGGIMGLLGDVVFFAAVVTMKDSWRAGIPAQDKTSLITGGIYKYSRNPAFLGFDLVYIGLLFMYFNVVLLAVTVWAVAALHLQVVQEEKFLEHTFGSQYLDYKNHTFRYFGRRRQR